MSSLADLRGIPACKWGEIAYEGYRFKSEGRSLISGSPIQEWQTLQPTIQAAWIAAAQAVLIAADEPENVY